MAPDLQFISLLRAGSSSSRDTRPTSRRPTYYLRHFREAGRLVRERQHPFRDARPIIYVTSGRRAAQFARGRAKVVTHDLLFTSLLRAGSLLLSGSSLLPSAFAFSLEPSKFNGDQMAFSPEPSLPCSSGRLLPPAPASRVAQFARGKANSVTGQVVGS